MLAAKEAVVEGFINSRQGQTSSKWGFKRVGSTPVKSNFPETDFVDLQSALTRYDIFKRLFDLVGASFLILATSPLMIAAVIAGLD